MERMQEILSPFRSPEELIIKTMECKEVNSWYRRENFKPTVTICYEFLKRILESLPNEINPDNVTPADAAVGQFLWVALHEVGHATFDLFDVPIFGSVEERFLGRVEDFLVHQQCRRPRRARRPRQSLVS